MKTFEIQTPDGRTFEVQAPTAEAAAQAVESMTGPQAAPRPADLDAFLSGTGAFADEGVSNPAPESATAAQKLGRSTQIAAQSVGSGLAAVAGMPADLAGAGIDLGLAGVEKGINLFRDEPVELPRLGPMPLGQQHLSSSAGDIMSAIGIDPIERDDMADSERLLYDMGRFGTEAATMGAGLSRAAQNRFPSGTMEGQSGRIGDGFLRPYVGRGAAPLVGDTVAGVGAGTGYNIAKENFPDSQVAELIGIIGGGTGGAAIANTPTTLMRGGRSIAEHMTPSSLPMDASSVPVNKRVERRAAEMAQSMAEDPQRAAETIARRADEGAGGPVATSGLLSGDTRLSSAEQAARLRNRAPFIERDQQVAQRASDNVSDLKDTGADVYSAQRAAQDRPLELAADRDAAALPLLRQAEQSGAVVDPQPVVDRIDKMLGEAKRPAVVNALKDARRMLNRAGTEDLDTSVSGLYETRKAINDLIEGRTDTPTGRYAKKELIEVRDLLDEQINAVAPEFGQYLKTYREGSAPINELRDSAQVAKMLEQKPQDVAHSLLSGNSYASPERMREITSAIKHNPEAMRGWRAAVAEVVSDKVRNVGGDLARDGADGPVSIAKMRRVYGQHKDALAEVFSPEDMATLERSHELLSPLENRRLQATTGSGTAENAVLVGAWDALGTALTFKYGAVHTGMIMHRLKRTMNLMPGMKEKTLDNQALHLVNRMWFDPDIARHLLEADVTQIQNPGWNKKLNKLIGATEVLRPDEEEDETLGAIMGDAPGSTGTGVRGPMELTVAKPNNSKELMEAIGGR